MKTYSHQLIIKSLRFTRLNLLIALITFSSLSFSNNKGDRCTEWNSAAQYGRESKIFIKICEYESGGSGYYKFKNDNNSAVRISFVITFNNGSTWEASTNVKAYSETNGSSCFNCAKKNSGAQHWSLKSVAFEGEEGYW